MSLIADARRRLVDRELADVDGRLRWVETIRGADAVLTLDARHLRRVLAARRASGPTSLVSPIWPRV